MDTNETPTEQTPVDIGTLDYATPQTPAPDEEQKQQASGWFDGGSLDLSWVPVPDGSFDVLSGMGEAVGTAVGAAGSAVGTAAGAVAEAAGEVVGGILEGFSI